LILYGQLRKTELKLVCFAIAFQFVLLILRVCHNSGQPVEAILQIGPRLEHWSREPEPSMVVNDMFGLVPGEDRLFANTILLRLADAFRIGDKDTKLAVVKIFLSEYRHRNKRKKSNGNKGILSKARVHNHLELLTRVKVVFDTGDVESKALALALFGCWADFAKDSAQIRYLILSSLVSSHVLEVRLVSSLCVKYLMSSIVLFLQLNFVCHYHR
jgi:integrator complex subunit 7